jgi:peroxiredoxin
MHRSPFLSLTLGGLLLVAVGCSKPAGVSESSPPTATPTSAPAAAQTAAPSTAAPSKGAAVTASGDRAELGKPAPNFSLPDLDGKQISLADFSGKIVVLEWFNPGCPFVKLAHTKGSLVDTAARHTKEGVVWLAINSGAPGKQGHGVEANRSAKQALQMNHPLLIDESGKVGRQYGAERTPHLFVIDATGTLVYAGAIDNSPDAEGQSPTSGKLVNYVDQTLRALRTNEPVPVSETEAYGCTVKYDG